MHRSAVMLREWGGRDIGAEGEGGGRGRRSEGEREREGGGRFLPDPICFSICMVFKRQHSAH